MTSLTLFLSNFHFIRPWWFIAVIGLFFSLWLIKKLRFTHSPWNKLLPAHLSQILVEGSRENQPLANKSSLLTRNIIKPVIIGLMAITALAGPTWQKLPQPVYQTQRGAVLIMDMSYSMYATDVKPNRLTRSRYKAIDLLNKINEGDIGLIAYAGDAFTISPLTQDIKNIELLLPSLTPEIMPELGSNPFAALALADEMLKNSGHLQGEIYWFTDDIDNQDINDIYDWSEKYGHRLNILGIGTKAGAPITLPSGELLKDNHGAIVIPKLPAQKLAGLAQRGNGRYQTIGNDDSDIDRLAANQQQAEQNKNEQQSQQSGDQWQEQGPWLLIVALPFLLSYFRRGSAVLMLALTATPLMLLSSALLMSSNSFAQNATNTQQLTKSVNAADLNKLEEPAAPSTSDTSTSKQLWNNLWQTQDQQAQQRYQQHDYQGAANQFKDSQWQGSAHFQAGNYQQALESFQQGEQASSADSLYNQGNALAKMQQYEQAIEQYQQALTKNPELQDAKDNIAAIKQLQQQNQNNEQNQDQDQEQEKNQDQQSSEENQQGQDQQSQQEQQNSEQSEQQSEQNANESDSSSKNSDSQQSDSTGEQEQSSKKAEDENAEQNQDQAQQQKQNEDQQTEEELAQQQAQAAKQKSEADNEQGQPKTAAQIAAEQQAKETEQKHQQLLNKVTDDPYLLLRNKMKIEYQKRRQEGSRQGAKQKW